MRVIRTSKIVKEPIQTLTKISRENIAPAVCSLLHDLRIKSKLSLDNLASRTNISRDYLYQLEATQDTEVRISTLLTILDAMGYDMLIVPKTHKVARSATDRVVDIKDKKEKQSNDKAKKQKH